MGVILTSLWLNRLLRLPKNVKVMWGFREILSKHKQGAQQTPFWTAWLPLSKNDGIVKIKKSPKIGCRCKWRVKTEVVREVLQKVQIVHRVKPKQWNAGPVLCVCACMYFFGNNKIICAWAWAAHCTFPWLSFIHSHPKLKEAFEFINGDIVKHNQVKILFFFCTHWSRCCSALQWHWATLRTTLRSIWNKVETTLKQL